MIEDILPGSVGGDYLNPVRLLCGNFKKTLPYFPVKGKCFFFKLREGLRMLNGSFFNPLNRSLRGDIQNKRNVRYKCTRQIPEKEIQRGHGNTPRKVLVGN